MEPERVWELALALPEAHEAPHFDFTSFRVRGKIFATVPPEHDRVHVFVDDVDAAIALDPASITELWWGKKRVGVRVDIARADESLLGELLRQAWRKKAPKRMAGA